jgi:peroxiredoxin
VSASTWFAPLALVVLLGGQSPREGVRETRISADSLARRNAAAAERAASDSLPRPAPDFMLRDLGGVPRRFLGYPGRVHLLVYWSPECPECVLEMPRLARLYARHHGRGLAVVGVTNPQLRDKAAAFAKGASLGFPILLDEKGKVARLYSVRMTPTVWVVRGGQVVYRQAGYDPAVADSLEPTVEALLR